MRVSKHQVAANREAIVRAAGRLFREKGFDAVTVAEVMRAAGMTHGGFYGYFKTKDDLFAAAMAQAMEEVASEYASIAARAERYLTPAHRADMPGGCPMAALAGEMPRRSGEARGVMTDSLREQIDRMTAAAQGPDAAARRRVAIGSWSAMLGALILARMSDDPELSGEVLAETRAWLADRDG
ncbi:TetR/AcrR family transcriptional regulator [Pseudodonghicola flavimaris]|uniref:Helix-turn-helix domain-containing protein n=1 Tax=Pseudodonghicola flavimaris TaxID=3050036 RepID=A0ABT7F1P4_9RHOB|nr:TetR/AcrR family transcriptional regulator [Pseudodonghicola flavimaris]MDK3018425.1 helix-turn-helix domain-containing protein [Pseudodonghicola flavimaris]